MKNIQHEILSILCLKGMKKPEYDDNVLKIYTEVKDYQLFQKAELYLDDSFIQVTTITNDYNLEFSRSYYVLEDGIFNWRTFKDVSVQKHLKRLGAVFVPRKELHEVAFEFGKSEEGKMALSSLIEKMNSEFWLLHSEEDVKIRNWDQNKDVFITQRTTKFILKFSASQIEALSLFLQNNGYPEQGDVLYSNRMKALMEPLDLTLDFKELFKKRKKQTK